MISSHLHIGSKVLFCYLQVWCSFLMMRSARLLISRFAPFFQLCHYWDFELQLCGRALFTQSHLITYSCLSWGQRFSHAPILNWECVRKEITRASFNQKNLQFSCSLHSSSSCRTAVYSFSSSISFLLPPPPNPKPHPPPALYDWAVLTSSINVATRFSNRAFAAA